MDKLALPTRRALNFHLDKKKDRLYGGQTPNLQVAVGASAHFTGRVTLCGAFPALRVHCPSTYLTARWCRDLWFSVCSPRNVLFSYRCSLGAGPCWEMAMSQVLPEFNWMGGIFSRRGTPVVAFCRLLK